MLGQLGVAELACAVGGDFTGAALVRHHHEFVTGLRYFGQTLNLNRNGRTGFLDRLAVFVQHGAHAAKGLACQHHVTRFERARLHQNRGHGAATFVQTRLNHQALGHGRHRGAQFQHLGLQEHLLQQLVNALAGFGRHRHKGRIATKFFRHHFFNHQLVFHALGVGIGLVDLVDRHDDGHARRLGVFDRLFGLRHHAVVCSHHQNHDVGCLGAAGTHGGKRLVARGVEERDHAARGFHVVGANVLGNATGFA